MPMVRTSVQTQGVAEPVVPVVDDRRPREPKEILPMTALTPPSTTFTPLKAGDFPMIRLRQPRMTTAGTGN